MRKEKGITLIALVVTIIVLITLASVSIGALTGDNGIINQSKQAKEETEIAEEKEAVEISAVQAAGMDRYGYVTEENFRNQLNNNIGNGKYELDVIGEKFKVTYTESQRSYYVDKNGNIEIADGSNNDGIYSEPGAEEQIAPTDLFNFEIIDVSAKTAKILGIKSQYCNVGGFNTETQKEDLPDTNYRINYSGITDTLVIPYQTEIDGEIYTITEVDLSIEQIDEFGKEICKYSNLPDIETIIYPNTVTKVYSASDIRSSYATSMNSILKKIVLSENLKEIPRCFLAYAKNLKEVTIPKSVIYMSREVFRDWDYTQTINVPFKEGETPSGWDEYWNDWCDATINYLK